MVSKTSAASITSATASNITASGVSLDLTSPSGITSATTSGLTSSSSVTVASIVTTSTASALTSSSSSSSVTVASIVTTSTASGLTSSPSVTINSPSGTTSVTATSLTGIPTALAKPDILFNPTAEVTPLIPKVERDRVGGPDSLQRFFPRSIPFGTVTVDNEPHTYRELEREDGTTTTKTTYVLNKAPFETIRSVTATVNGSQTELTQGSDYSVVDSDDDGQVDAIDFSFGGDNPDLDTEFTVTYVAVSVIDRYIDPYEESFDRYDIELENVIDSHHVNQASGQDLDLIGSFFGNLGTRSGRTDSEYRSYLKSIVQAFKGRGTTNGIEFAVASGIGTTQNNVDVIEDFSQNTYRVSISDYNDHSTDVVREMAQLADPSGVAFSGPIQYVRSDDIVVDTGTGVQVIKPGTTVSKVTTETVIGSPLGATRFQPALLGRGDIGNRTLGG